MNVILRLSTTSPTMPHGDELRGVLRELEASLSEKTDDDAAQLKPDIAKQRRTLKRHEKARQMKAERDVKWLGPSFRVLSRKCGTSIDSQQRARKQAQAKQKRTAKRNARKAV